MFDVVMVCCVIQVDDAMGSHRSSSVCPTLSLPKLSCRPEPYTITPS